MNIQGYKQYTLQSREKIVECRHVTGQQFETNNETTSAAMQQILNKQVHAAATE
jgi:hypothetical protein